MCRLRQECRVPIWLNSSRDVGVVPSADILAKLAPVYDVPVRDLLKAAGYLGEAASNLSEEEEVEMAFRYVMSDPRYKSGTRISRVISTHRGKALHH